MVESLVLRLRRLRAVLARVIQRVRSTSGAIPEEDEIYVVTSVGKQRWRSAEETGANILILTIMIGSAIYAPFAQAPWIFWGAAGVCAELMDIQGMDWQRLWREASLKVMAW